MRAMQAQGFTMEEEEPADMIAGVTAVTFSETVGLFVAACKDKPSAPVAALFLSPWGLEEMCVRKAWRHLCENLSDSGVPSLRFDFPGTGDALDVEDFSGGFERWDEAAMEAASRLKALSGCAEILLVAQGLGAAVAARICGRIAGVRGVALLAPIVNGRRYLREVSMWSKVVNEALGLPADASKQVSIAGLVLPEGLASAVRTVDLQSFRPVPSVSFLVCERPGNESDAQISAHLAALGAPVERLTFEGHAALVADPTISRIPVAFFDRLLGWATRMSGPGDAIRPSRKLEHPQLSGADFVERPVFFGPRGRLFGIVCEPADGTCLGSVVMMGTAYDRHAGWARSAVETARALAGSGIVSLRFDAAGIADSAPAPGRKSQVLYAAEQVEDGKAALDLMESLGFPPPVLVGRCSGAYLAFQTALHDLRCRALVAVNIVVFRWDPRDDVDEMIRHNPRSLTDYKKRAFSAATVSRFLSGKINLSRAVRNIVKMAARHVLLVASPVLGGVSIDARLRNSVHADFRSLQERRVPVSLVYSENDIGLARLSQTFGRGGGQLSQYANVSLSTIAAADHNVTPAKARAQLRDHIRDVVLSVNNPAEAA